MVVCRRARFVEVEVELERGLAGGGAWTRVGEGCLGWRLKRKEGGWGS